jgi:hypothetical protein
MKVILIAKLWRHKGKQKTKNAIVAPQDQAIRKITLKIIFLRKKLRVDAGYVKSIKKLLFR